MTVLIYTLGVVIFVVAILASIGLHELGHMIPAKRFGARVTQYFIGFGNTLWSRQKGETEYGVKAIPLGGYVKIVGMLPPGKRDAVSGESIDEDGNVRVRRSNTGLFSQLVSDARAAEWELVRDEDADRLFYKLPWWKKVIVMAGGPTVNILIAFFIFAGVFATYGNPADAHFTRSVAQVAECVVPYRSGEEPRACTAQDPKTPAFQAGMRPGDEIVAFNGEPIDDWEELQTVIRGNSDGRASITIVRDGTERTLHTNTTVTARPDEPGGEKVTEVGFLGVVPDSEVPTGGVGYTLQEMGGMTVDTLQALAQLPVKVYHVGLAVVGLEERSADSPVSIVGGGRIAGETAAEERLALEDKAAFLLLLIAGFNFFIGMFNFVPLLPLDGGHIAGALWEGLRRAWARLRGLPDPGHVDVARLLPVAYVVAAGLAVMGVILIVADLVVPISPYS